MKSLILLFCLTVVLLVEGKHMHHRSTVRSAETEQTDSNDNEKVADVDGMSIDAIRKLRPSRFVPINSIFSFKVYAPCEEGFERDLLGDCREVWD